MTETVTAEVAADEAPGLLPLADVLARTGMTYRQLDYATRAGYLRPDRRWKGRRWGTGSPRIWPEEELEVARLMGRLTAAGLPLETAHAIARSGEPRHELAPGIWIEVAA